MKPTKTAHDCRPFQTPNDHNLKNIANPIIVSFYPLFLFGVDLFILFIFYYRNCIDGFTSLKANHTPLPQQKPTSDAYFFQMFLLEFWIYYIYANINCMYHLFQHFKLNVTLPCCVWLFCPPFPRENYSIFMPS